MGILFSILSPALYGINNYIDKFFLEKYRLSPIVITIFGGIFSFIFGIIILFLTGFHNINLTSIFIILLSGFLTCIYNLPYYKALSEDETSRVIPLFQFVPIIVIILSFLFLGERLQFRQYIGSAAIMLGAFLLSLKHFNLRIFKIRPAFWHMLLSSFIFSVSIVLYKFGVERIPFWNTLPYEGFGIALGALVIWLYKNNKKILKKESKKIDKRAFVVMSVNEIIYLFSRFTAYFALSLITASVVNVLAGFQPFFVLLYGILLSVFFPKIIKENIKKEIVVQKIIFILFIFLGLYLLS